MLALIGIELERGYIASLIARRPKMLSRGFLGSGSGIAVFSYLARKRSSSVAFLALRRSLFSYKTKISS